MYSCIWLRSRSSHQVLLMMRWRHHKLGEFAIACSETFWGFFPYSLNKKNVTLVLLFYIATCLLVLNVTTYLTIHCKKPTTYINIAFKNVWDCATPNNNLIWKCVKIYYHTLIQFCECDLERKWNLLVVVCNVATKKNEASVYLSSRFNYTKKCSAIFHHNGQAAPSMSSRWNY